MSTTTHSGPLLGDTVAFSKSTFRIQAISAAKVEAVLLDGPARDNRVVFARKWLVSMGPGHWKANSYTILPEAA